MPANPIWIIVSEPIPVSPVKTTLGGVIPLNKPFGNEIIPDVPGETIMPWA